MDRKTILLLAVCFLLLFAWTPLVNRIYPPVPVQGSTNAPSANVTQLQAPTNTATAPLTPTLQAPTVPQPASVWTPPSTAESLVSLETEETRFVFTSHGGGLRRVELKKYPESVRRKKGDSDQAQRLATLNAHAPVPALALLGGPEIHDAQPYRLTEPAQGVVRAEKSLSNGLAILKEFRIDTNHLLHVALRLENQGKEPLVLPAHELVIGTATPISGTDDGTMVRVEWFDGRSASSADQAWFANRTLGCLPGTPRTEYASAGTSNIVWGSVQNQFFAMIALPAEIAPRLVARPVDLPRPTPEELAANKRLNAQPRGFQAALAYDALTLAPGQALTRELDVFAGPKEYNALVKLGRGIDQVMGFSGFFGWFAKLLLLSMNGLHRFGLPYGAAIIAITVIIKILFWPLTQASTRSMKRMQSLQPQMKAIQAKYKDDPKKMNQKLMEFMKQNRVSPLGGCLPLLLQIPVFFGFFQMLRSAIELRGARFLWAYDLSQPDTVAMIFGFPLNPLPLIMGATQFWQARLTPPSPGVDPMQQKLMQYMPLIFVFMLYNFSAGLALYWTVQNLLSILQMKLTKGTAPAPAPVPSPAPARRR
ncbi:MAG TPA: membrane protein insertase YidC [Verrucomicrobiota bacterium]|nr:membrane protein insertase YidC [Verrucomicrobiota bacterium]